MRSAGSRFQPAVTDDGPPVALGDFASLAVRKLSLDRWFGGMWQQTPKSSKCFAIDGPAFLTKIQGGQRNSPGVWERSHEVLQPPTFCLALGLFYFKWLGLTEITAQQL